MPTAKLHSFYSQRHSLFSLQSPGGNRRQQIPQVQPSPSCMLQNGVVRALKVKTWGCDNLGTGNALERKQLADTETKKPGEILLMFHLINYYIKMRTEASASQTHTRITIALKANESKIKASMLSHIVSLSVRALCANRIRIKNNQTLLTQSKLLLYVL